MVRIIQEVVRLKEVFEAHLMLFHKTGYISCVTIFELSTSTQLSNTWVVVSTFTLNSSRLNMDGCRHD